MWTSYVDIWTLTELGLTFTHSMYAITIGLMYGS